MSKIFIAIVAFIVIGFSVDANAVDTLLISSTISTQNTASDFSHSIRNNHKPFTATASDWNVIYVSKFELAADATHRDYFVLKNLNSIVQILRVFYKNVHTSTIIVYQAIKKQVDSSVLTVGLLHTIQYASINHNYSSPVINQSRKTSLKSMYKEFDLSMNSPAKNTGSTLPDYFLIVVLAIFLFFVVIELIVLDYFPSEWQKATSKRNEDIVQNYFTYIGVHWH